MELRPGYKQTEIGEVPNDWRVEKLGERVTFRTGPFGSALHKSDYTDDGTPIVNPMHIINGHIVPSVAMTVPEAAANDLSEYKLKLSDVIIGRRGDMGRCAVVTKNEVGWLCGTGSLIIRCSEKVVPSFLQLVLSDARAVAAIENASVGSTMVNLNQGVLHGLKIQFPPLLEQRAIAAALSDTDALLSSLDRLLAKKRDIKQAVMQQLLTGKQRLPGFSGDWKMKQFGDVLKVRHGKSQHGVVEDKGNYPILATGGEIGRTNHFIYDRPSVLIGRKGTIDAPQYVKTPFWTIDTLFYTEIASSASPKFLYYLFNTINWRSYNEASGVPSLNASTIENIKIKCPRQDEQAAIAGVLSDMDAEIDALTRRRDKTRAVKQGMMQELLTGRTRLV